MPAVDVRLNWVHIICAVVFLGTMFVGTFAVLPVLKAHLDHQHRHQFIVNFIPRVRRIVRVFIALLVLSGVTRALVLHYMHDGPASASRLGVFSLHIFFAAVPVMIFVLAPRILGARSKDGLCCDPDADDPPLIKGIMGSRSTTLHYAAIGGGWLAVLCAIILGRVS